MNKINIFDDSTCGYIDLRLQYDKKLKTWNPVRPVYEHSFYKSINDIERHLNSSDMEIYVIENATKDSVENGIVEPRIIFYNAGCIEDCPIKNISAENVKGDPTTIYIVKYLDEKPNIYQAWAVYRCIRKIEFEI